jgi:sugar lactone lactonase YvrE
MDRISVRRRLRALVAALAAALAPVVCPGTAWAQTKDVGTVFAPLLTFGAAAGEGKLAEFAADIAIDSDGNVWVADAGNSRVLKYTYNGDFVTAVPVGEPLGLGADDAGFVYVVDGAADRVVKLTNGATLVSRLGAAAPGDGFLDSPNDVAVGPDGTVYVTDGVVERFAADGAALPPLSTVPAGSSIAVGPDGTVHTLEGRTVTRQGPAGDARGTIDLAGFTGTPTGLAVDRAGEVYVGFEGEGEVARLTAAGAVAERIGRSAAGDSLLVAIGRVAVDCRRNLYVTHTYAAPESSPPTNESAVVKFGDPEAQNPPCAPRTPIGDVAVQIDDVEVTQGIQPLRTTVPSRDAGGAQVRPADYDDPEFYGSTVGLAESRDTVVRVFASLTSGPPGGIANIPATLTVTQRVDGRTVEHEPILPIAQPAVLRVNASGAVAPAERTSPGGAYTFVLPTEWTRGSVALQARVNPAGIGCPSAECRNRATFRLVDVAFRPTAKATVWPLALTIDGALPVFRGNRLDTPGPAFDLARKLTPLPINLFPWLGRIEMGDVIPENIKIIETSCFLGIETDLTCSEEEKTADRDAREGIIYERIERWMDDNNAPPNVIVAGLMSNENPNLPGSMVGRLFDDDEQARGYLTGARPTTVAHELQHALGRPHASPGCGATGDQAGEPWPPDERGLLQGIGLDTQRGSGGGRGPFGVLAPGANGGPAEWFDLMSYCRGQNDAWVSPRGWQAVLGYGAPDRTAASVGPVLAQAGGVLRVVAVARADGSLAISGVSPAPGAPEPGDPASGYVLETRDAAGRQVLASSPMRAQPLADGGGGVALVGEVAAANAAMVVVRSATGAITRVLRSPGEPKVRLLAPRRRGARVARTLAVRWRASDPDGGTLSATVEYSSDGGRSWRTRHVGISTGQITVPVAELAPSRRARVRVRVDDGFSEAVATSPVFVVPPAPPQARIVEPPNDLRVAEGAPVVVRAEATAAGRLLAGRALRWFDGRRALGSGATLTVPRLDAGRRTLRLVATAAGRRTERRVRLRVAGVRPAFLVLSAPARATRRARSVRLRVATTVSATLTAGGRRFAVGPRTRTVRVPVRRGAADLRLVLRLRSAGGRAQTTLVIPRR